MSWIHCLELDQVNFESYFGELCDSVCPTVIMRQEAPWTHLGKDILIKFQPGLVALAIRVLQPEEPNLPQPYRFHHLSDMICEPFSNLVCMFT